MTTIKSEQIIENCSKCGGNLKLWDVEIRGGYKCFKCKYPMRIMLIYEPEPEPEEESRTIMQGEFDYQRHPSMIPLAAEFGVMLEKRHSKKTGYSYIAHICPNCKIIQGDHYVVNDNQQKTEYINSFKGLACKSCGHWEPVKVTRIFYEVIPIKQTFSLKTSNKLHTQNNKKTKNSSLLNTFLKKINFK